MSLSGLRPMTVGDILDQSFSIYRRNFVSLVGIVALIHVPLLLLQLAGGLLFGAQLSGRVGAPSFTQSQGLATVVGVGFLILSSVVSGVAHVFETSALCIVVSERLLGNPVSLRQAYARALGRWPALLTMIFSLGGATVFLLLVLSIPLIVVFAATAALSGTRSGLVAGGLAGGLIACLTCVAVPIVFSAAYGVWIRLLFATQAIVLENAGGIEGLQRSWRLVRGSFWRVLGITLILTILVGIIGGGPTYLIVILANALPSPSLALIIDAVVPSVINIFVLPLQFAAFTLLYYDLRIRKEGFDLALLAQQLVPTLGGLAVESAGGLSSA